MIIRAADAFFYLSAASIFQVRMSIQVFDHFVNHFFLAFRKNADATSHPLRKHGRNRSATTSKRHYFLIMMLAVFISIILALMLIVLFYSIEL
jgi:hypothetical protein